MEDKRGSGSQSFGRALALVAVGNVLLAGLLAAGVVGAVVRRDPTASLASASSTAAAAGVPEGYRMVCFKGADPHAVMRSAPDFKAPPAGVVLRGELMELAGPNPPVIAGNGFVKVHRAMGGKRITAWMHSDVLSTTACKP